jgi:hypothetical protein
MGSAAADRDRTKNEGMVVVQDHGPGVVDPKHAAAIRAGRRRKPRSWRRRVWVCHRRASSNGTAERWTLAPWNPAELAFPP